MAGVKSQDSIRPASARYITDRLTVRVSECGSQSGQLVVTSSPVSTEPAECASLYITVRPVDSADKVAVCQWRN